MTVVRAHTLLTNSPTGLERNGVPPDQVEASLRDVYANVPAFGAWAGRPHPDRPDRHRGSFEPGDTLEIRILKIDLAIPYAYNGFRLWRPGYPDATISPIRGTKIIPLDKARMVAHFAPGHHHTRCIRSSAAWA